MGRRAESIGVKPMGDGIEVRFKYLGRTLRPRLRLKATKANLMHAARLREEVMQQIAQGTFDIAKTFPDYRFAEQVRQEAPNVGRTFGEWVELWEKLAARKLEHSTLVVYQRHMADYWMPVFGHLVPAKITHEMILSRLAELASERSGRVKQTRSQGLSRKTQNNILVPLRGVFNLISRAPDAGPNPVDGIENLKTQVGDPDPFTVEEVELALADIRKRYGDELADYFEFAAYAGLRVSEQIALLWQDVDLRTYTIAVRRARVMGQEKERTKTAFSRTVELNSRAAAVIERQRGRTQLLGDTVFLSPETKKPWEGDKRQRDIWAGCLRRCKIRHRPAKELRDSSVTFALLAGADPYYVARQHGHSVTTMMKSYAKFIPNADRGRNRDAINRSLEVSVGVSVDSGLIKKTA